MRWYWSFLIFSAAAVLSCVLGFFTLDAAASLELFSKWGYFWIAGSFCLFLVLVLKQLKPTLVAFLKNYKTPPFFWGLGSVTLCTVYCLAVEPWGYRIVTDEPILIATSQTMAREGQVFVPQAGWEVDGEFLIFDYSVDKRPILYPFWVSLLHTLRGPFAENGSLLNNLLCPLFFVLLYVFLLQHVTPFFAALGLVLVAALPLSPTVFNGMGLEPSMLVMLLATLLLSKSYLLGPTPLRLSTLCLSTLLLAQTRYEMALFVPIVGVVILLGWYCVRKVVVSPLFLLIPLFFIPQAWQHSIFRFDPDPFQFDDAKKFGFLKETHGGFSPNYFFKNLEPTGRFFFGLLPASHPGSPPSNRLLSLLGFFGALWGLCRLALGGPRFLKKSSEFQVSILFGGGVLASFFLHMLYVWGRMDLPITYRFSLLFSITALLPFVQGVATVLGERKKASGGWGPRPPNPVKLAFFECMHSKKANFKLKACVTLLALGLLTHSGLRAHLGAFRGYSFFPHIVEFEVAFMQKTRDQDALYLTEMPYLALSSSQNALSCVLAMDHPQLVAQFRQTHPKSPIYAFQVSVEKQNARFYETPSFQAGFVLRPLLQASASPPSSMRVELFQVIGLVKPPAAKEAPLGSK